MKKKIVIVVLFTLALVISASLQACSKQKIYTLVIDNSVVSEDCICIQNDCFELPLVCVLKEIGIDVNWIDDDNAEFQWNGSDYSLTLRNKNLIRKSDGSAL